MSFEETCLQNLDAYLSQVADGWQFTPNDIEFIVSLNKSVAHRLKELLGDRVQAVTMPSFLYEFEGKQEPAIISIQKHCVVGSEAHRVADLTMQLIQPHVDDSGLTLFMHTIAVPGAWSGPPDSKIDRYQFRSRYTRERGVLMPVEMSSSGDGQETLQLQKPPGFGLTLEQLAEGTIY